MSDHYFRPRPGGSADRRTLQVSAWGHELALTTAQGLFSHDRLDRATDVLLRHEEPPATGTLLDLGCGWGPIACLLAAASPDADVWAVDVNPDAVEATRRNAARHRLDVRVGLPDEVPADLVVDEIWSNPPVRVGKAALHEALLRWLPHLAPHGVARMVVGRNLGADSLQRWLDEQGWPTERVGSEKGFRVLHTRRP